MNTNGTASGNGRQATVAGSGASSIQSTPRAKSHLVRLAEMEDRNKAPIKGYLKKENSQKRWQKRWFEIVGHYFVYYKRYDSPEMLCAMDLNRVRAILSRASRHELLNIYIPLFIHVRLKIRRL
eukprot:gb/GECG01003510.1/.p1 GENE.gb/GECG01003510.1/~~gb/GECG01003510.1/.p1  ORF type:complete len:124 (+),score=8.77 gb/GECG01003510.1/:1-372(+)